MSTEITVADVRQAAASLLRTLKALGMVPEEAITYLDPGSKHNGSSWAFRYWTPGAQGVKPGDYTKVPGLDLHGAYTRKEAWTRITSANTALQAVQTAPEYRDSVGGRLPARGYVQCPHAECGYVGTEAQVDDHRATGIHDDQPQAGANIRR